MKPSVSLVPCYVYLFWSSLQRKIKPALCLCLITACMGWGPLHEMWLLPRPEVLQLSPAPSASHRFPVPRHGEDEVGGVAGAGSYISLQGLVLPLWLLSQLKPSFMEPLWQPCLFLASREAPRHRRGCFSCLLSLCAAPSGALH